MEQRSLYTFCEYTVKSWDDCRSLLGYLGGWVFRGQSDKNWTLKTTLERAALINSTDIRRIPELESKIIENFQRRALYYLDKTPDKENILEWLSLIQHHGGPTRLLDFTYSYYVATYFSVDQALQDSAIFCINKELIYSFGSKTEDWRYRIIDAEFGTLEYCNAALKAQTLNPLVILVEPFNKHERLSRQQGLFAVPLEGRQAFEYNLSLTEDNFRKGLPDFYMLSDYNKSYEILDEDCLLLKIIIPKKFHNGIRKDLLLMNITTETLFPGIDGFTKSLINEFNI